MKRFILWTFMAFLTMGGSFPALAYEILVTVNDDVISDYDVNMRLKMMQTLLKAPDTKEMKEKILDTLIVEKLKRDAGAQESITVTQAEIDDGIAFLEEQNGMEKETLKKIFEKEKIPFETLLGQMRADLIWLKILREKNHKAPDVSSSEIQKRLEGIRSEMMKPGYLLAEIYIPFGKDALKAERQATELFDRVVKGEVFPELARTYSKGKTAHLGGDLGWVDEQTMEKAIAEILPKMDAGQLSRPVKGEKGYYLILMRDKRKPLTSTDVEAWSISQMLIPQSKVAALLPEIQKTDGNCMTFTSLAIKEGLKGSGEMGDMPVPRMPDQLFQVLKEAPVKQIVGPIEADDFSLFFMKCAVKEISLLPDKDVIRKQIEMEKMEKISDNMIKKLKKEAVIEKK